MNDQGRPPAEDLTKTCWRDETWLQLYPLTLVTVMDYFALSPFFATSEGMDWVVTEVQEPHLFVIEKRPKAGADAREAAAPAAVYFVLDTVVYQAPTLHAVLGARLQRCLHGLRGSFSHVLQLKEMDGDNARPARG
mmetsp:Transcript_3124/g.8474  ORF Transcript_3124/g.8474 Transcript_3124/m.8474 type:complete len:136 (-) Transcript_3124:250-657(-)